MNMSEESLQNSECVFRYVGTWKGVKEERVRVGERDLLLWVIKWNIWLASAG